MFYSYSLSNFLILIKEFLILSAILRTALDYSGLILLIKPSASNKISKSRSSRPLPSKLATELI